MATATTVPPKPVTYPHIVKVPGVRGGKATIEGTRIAVKDVVSAYETGSKPEEIRTYFSSRPLTLAEVHAALAYYHDNREEIEAEFAAEERRFEEMEREWAEYVARHGGQPPDKPEPGTHPFAKPFPWPPQR